MNLLVLSIGWIDGKGKKRPRGTDIHDKWDMYVYNCITQRQLFSKGARYDCGPLRKKTILMIYEKISQYSEAPGTRSADISIYNPEDV
jgi:hypothetical protein